MRYKRNYTLYKRGKYWYYRTYSSDGKRTCGKSTGQTVKTKAILMCDELLKSGNLIAPRTVLFETYAKGFFDEGSCWYIDKCLDSVDGTMPITYNRLKGLRHFLRCHVMPYWKRYTLEGIKLYDIKMFRSKKLDDGYAISTVEQIVGCLKIIMDKALSDKLIVESPFLGLKSLKGAEKKNRESFTDDEVIAICSLMKEKEYSLWFFITALCTGMRLSEIMAVRRETLFEGYIVCADQLGARGVLCPTKTKKSRYIPIPRVLYEKLVSLIKEDGFCFGAYPGLLAQRTIKGYSNDSGRAVTFHSARHYFNTYMLARNISNIKVAAVAGHTIKDVEMQNIYTNWEPTHFPEIVKEQELLLARILESLNI